MNIYTIDFETFYDRFYSLSKLTTEAYVRDEQFEVIGVGVLTNGEDPQWMEEDEFREWAATIDWENSAVVAHHAHFDGLILSHHFGIFPGQWFDTLSMSRPIVGNGVGGGLAKLAKHFGIGEKGDEVIKAIGKRRRDFMPAEWDRYGQYCLNDARITWDLFLRFIDQIPEDELRLIDLTVRWFTEPILVLDESMMLAAYKAEIARKESLMAKIADDPNVVRRHLLSNDKFAVLLAELGVEPPLKWSAKKGREDFAFAKSDPGMQILLDHDNPEVRALIEARLGVKSTINETRTQRFLKLGAGGQAMPVYLSYAGAHTFRWAGGDKMNWQNLERTDDSKPEKGAIRKAIRAPEWGKIVVADSGQIEARTLGWLAGHEELLQAFREGRDVYSEFATEAFGRHIDGKNRPEDKIPRLVGKVCRLGLGYQMSTFKLAMSCAAGPMGNPPLFFTEGLADSIQGFDLRRFVTNKEKMEKVEQMPSKLPIDKRVIHCAVADHFVRAYRENNQCIVEFWKFCEELLMMMVEGTEYDMTTEDGHLVLRTCRHGFTLPSGLTMKYPDLKVSDDGGFSYFNARYKSRQHIYGGMLTENIDQALSRIIVSDQILRATDAGLHVVTSTHDEIVCVEPEEDAEAALEVLLDIMKTPPKWCADLPLSAEGACALAYGDAK